MRKPITISPLSSNTDYSVQAWILTWDVREKLAGKFFTEPNACFTQCNIFARFFSMHPVYNIVITVYTKWDYANGNLSHPGTGVACC